MRAGWTEPGQIHRFAPLQSLANECDPLVGEIIAKLMKARRPEKTPDQPSRGAKTGGAEARMLGTNSLVRHLQRRPKKVDAKHQSYLAARNNVCSAPQNIRPLARAPFGCDNRGKSKAIPGESDAGAR